MVDGMLVSEALGRAQRSACIAWAITAFAVVSFLWAGAILQGRAWLYQHENQELRAQLRDMSVMVAEARAERDQAQNALVLRSGQGIPPLESGRGSSPLLLDSGSLSTLDLHPAK